MTEQEFYKRKIFDKASLATLKSDFPLFASDIVIWYKSTSYSVIQRSKSFLLQKLKQMEEDKEKLSFSNDQLYALCTWYINTPKVCHYCSLPENSLELLRSLPGHINKRYPQRGKSLEIDRKQSDLPYTVIDNLVLACYWCNNAKTDTFSSDEFAQIGQVIRQIWKDRFAD